MFKLKENFLLGVATASTQIEGGRVNSNWNDFCDRKMTNDGSDVARANMHYEKLEEDTKLLKKMEIQTMSGRNFDCDIFVEKRIKSIKFAGKISAQIATARYIFRKIINKIFRKTR